MIVKTVGIVLTVNNRAFFARGIIYKENHKKRVCIKSRFTFNTDSINKSNI